MSLVIVKVGTDFIRVGKEIRTRKFHDHVVSDLQSRGGLDATYCWESTPWADERVRNYFKREDSNRRWRVFRHWFGLSEKPNQAHSLLIRGAVILNGSCSGTPRDREWLRENEIP